MLNDNAANWTDAGQPYSEPEWATGRQHPVSHDMDSHVVLEVELAVGPANASMELGAMFAEGSGLDFESPMVEFEPGAMSITLTSKEPLSAEIRAVDLSLAWSIEWWRGDMNATLTPAATSNVSYMTMSKPRLDTWEDGATRRRMTRAVEWVEPLGTIDPHRIVEDLFRRVPNYTLHRNENVPASYGHPAYFNDDSGAWPLTDYPQYAAECQAIVRMVRAIAHQIGLPGKTDVVVIWTDPNVNGGQTVLEAAHGEGGLGGRVRHRNGVCEHPKLADMAVEVGTTYQDVPGNPGMNNFEACMRYEHAGEVVYHAGGAGTFDAIDDIIGVFWGLVWIRKQCNPDADDADTFTVTEIVHTWA